MWLTLNGDAMKKSMLRRTTLRDIRNSLGRFFAILAITALGVGFFCGVRITTPAMVHTVNSFLQETQFYDYRLISSLGWEDEDVEALQNQENVRYAEGSVSFDAVYCIGDDWEGVFKTYTLPTHINTLVLREGRMPQLSNEVIADQDSSAQIGDCIHVSALNTEDTKAYFSEDEFIVVGKADSPLYFNHERGSTSIGNGSVSGFLYVMPESLDVEYYTEIYVRFERDDAIYSKAYKNFMESHEAEWKDITQTQAESRFERIFSDAQAEIQDGKNELEQKRAEGQQELDDAEQELADAKADLEKGKMELADAEQTLADGKKELEDAELSLADARKQLDDAKIQTENGKKELDENEQKLSAAYATLATAKQQLDASSRQLNDGQEQLNAGQMQLSAAAAALLEQEQSLLFQESELQSQEAVLQEQLSMLPYLPEEQQAALLAAQQELEAAKLQIAAGKEQIAAGKQEIQTQQAVLEQKQAELSEGWEAYRNGLSQYQAGLSEYETGCRLLEEGRTSYLEGLKKYEDGESEYSDGIAKLEEAKQNYEEGYAEYLEGVQSYEDGKAKYEEGLAEYKDGKAEFDEKIADAEAELADAEEQLADLAHPDTYVLDRTVNIGYSCFESDSQIVEQVAKVFPIFFILVAALVCMTTMSRMIEEQRTQIGTLKALGYSASSIMGKFMFYSGSAALTGCILGYAVGVILFPSVIWMSYELMYVVLPIEYLFDWKLAVGAALISLACSCGITWFSCRMELAETAASLMRPKAPKSGKRVFLEYIPFLWNRMKFLHKVSFRNLFRYKGRFFMMVLGISGCTALLLTGFGLRDSVAGFADVQYGEIQTADASVSFSSSVGTEISEELRNTLAENTEDYVLLHQGAWDLVLEDKVKGITLIAPDTYENFDRFMHFRTESGNVVDAPEQGEAIISNSLRDRYEIEIGDSIVLRDENMRELHLYVTGVFENHVYNYVFTASDTLTEQFRAKQAWNGAYLNFSDGTDHSLAQTEIAKSTETTNVMLFDEFRVRMGNMMSSLDYIVLLVIFCAAGLAFVVLYNLTNINITERIREIATIKVLGFFRNETSAYVQRENLALTGIGIAVGLGLGILLHRFVIAQIVVDLVSFRVRILPLSFLWSILLTFAFNLLVNLVMSRKLDKINMAESLKSIE